MSHAIAIESLENTLAQVRHNQRLHENHIWHLTHHDDPRLTTDNREVARYERSVEEFKRTAESLEGSIEFLKGVDTTAEQQSQIPYLVAANDEG